MNSRQLVFCVLFCVLSSGMFMNQTLLLAALVAAFSTSTLAAEPSVSAMLSEGQTLAVYKDSRLGLCVGAIGTVDKTSSKNRDLEIARSLAIEELSGFISGTRVTSNTRMRLESVNGKSSESFVSDVRTSIKSYLRAIEVVRSGEIRGGRYAFARVCQKSVDISKELRNSLDNNTVQAVGAASLEQGREKARRLALDDALRNAVTQYTGVSTASQTTVRNATEIQSKMATRSSGAVSRYKIVSETLENGMLRIEIIATVEEKTEDTANLSQAVRENMGRPSIYIETKDRLARQAFEELLKKNQFDITRNRKHARFIMSVEADYEESPMLDDMMGRRTTLNISLKDRMSADQAIQLSNDPEESTEASDNARIRAQRSMKYAVASIEKELLGKLSGQFVDQFNNGTKVLIAFHKFGRLREAENMTKLLESFPLTKKVSLRPIDASVAYYDVLYLGDPSELQMMVLKSSPKFRLHGLKAKNKKGDGLDFTF